jgi:type I restriction enzyme S subunit
LTPKDGIEARFLQFVMHSRRFVNEATRETTGDRPRVSFGTLAEIDVPIAPTTEQRRIVKRIDDLFSEIADGETALTRARADLDTWRRALLKTAVTGELTREWRENNAPNQSGVEVLATAQALRSHFGARKGALSEKNVKAPTNWLDLPEIPSGWIWAKLSDFAWASSYGTSAKCSPDAGGMAVLRIPNIQDGRINLQNLKRATIDLEIPQQEALAPGDILVVRTNGSADLIGRAALISSPLAETTYFASYLIRFRIVANELIQKWISLFLSSPVARAWVHKNIASSAGQYNISQSALMALPIPVPPFIEMRQALEVSTQLDSIRRDTETEANQAQAGRHILTQSILKAAFAGLLVDQDPRDEPADSLLSRLSSPIAGAARAPISRAGRTSKAAQ